MQSRWSAARRHRSLCFSQGRVVAGHKDALDLVQRAAATKGALKVVLLPVSGAFHTSLMKPAQDALVKARRHGARMLLCGTCL